MSLKKKRVEHAIDDMIQAMKEEQPTIYLASRYATKEDRINALYRIMERGKAYHPDELSKIWRREYGSPISRVAVSHYLTVLGAAGRVDFRGRGPHGKNLYCKP